MESMQTWENIEFSVEHGRVTNVATLVRIYGDVFVTLGPLLIS